MVPVLDYLVSDRWWETPSEKKRKNSWVSRSDTKVYLLALLQLPHLCSVNNRHCLSCLLPYRLTREYPIAFRDWEKCPTPPPWQLNVGIQQKNRVSSKYKQTSVPRAKRWHDCTEILLLTAERECINPHLTPVWDSLLPSLGRKTLPCTALLVLHRKPH